MNKDMSNATSNTRLVVTVVVLLLFGWFIYLLAPMLTPFLVGALLAYIGNPLVSRLARWHLPRVLGVIVVFLLFTVLFVALVFYLAPLVRDSIVGFARRVPEYQDWLVAQLPRLEAWLGVKLALDLDTLRQSLTGHWQELGNWVTKALGVAGQSGLAVIGWVVNLVLIPVVTFYLLLDWEQTVARVASLVPPAYQGRVRQLARETDEVLGSFLRGQLLVMVALATVYSVGLSIIGLDLALPIGLLAGTVSFVPYLGFIVGITSAGIAAYVQYQDAFMLVWVAVVFGIGQVLEGMFLTPRLVGSRIGLHPVAVIFAVMAGAQLFGFVGVLVALPAAAALKVWLLHAHEAWVRPNRPVARARRR
jgi:predicted PurR-regulated permease PerM